MKSPERGVTGRILSWVFSLHSSWGPFQPVCFYALLFSTKCSPLFHSFRSKSKNKHGLLSLLLIHRTSWFTWVHLGALLQMPQSHYYPITREYICSCDTYRWQIAASYNSWFKLFVLDSRRQLNLVTLILYKEGLRPITCFFHHYQACSNAITGLPMFHHLSPFPFETMYSSETWKMSLPVALPPSALQNNISLSKLSWEINRMYTSLQGPLRNAGLLLECSRLHR